MKISGKTFVALLAMAMAQAAARVGADKAAFWELHQKTERDVLELAAAVEEAFAYRCEASTLDDCVQGNYDACKSSFPNPICLESTAGDDLYHREPCAFDIATESESESECGAVWDLTVSSISVPSSSDTMDPDPDVAESVCFSKALDTFFVDKAIEDQDFWAQRGMVGPPWMYFGSTSGVSRMYPARPQEVCRNDDAGDELYDPRKQPW